MLIRCVICHDTLWSLATRTHGLHTHIAAADAHSHTHTRARLPAAKARQSLCVHAEGAIEKTSLPLQTFLAGTGAHTHSTGR